MEVLNEGEGVGERELMGMKASPLLPRMCLSSGRAANSVRTG